MNLVTRNRTTDFLKNRKKAKKKSEDELDKTLEMIAKVALRSDAEIKRHQKDMSSTCASCRVSFGWWLYSKEERIICQLCHKSFCNNCAPHTVTLKTTFSKDNKVRACLGCEEHVTSYYHQLEFQEKKREAESSVLVNFYRDTRTLQVHILQSLERYSEIVSTITIADYIQPDPSLFKSQSESQFFKSMAGWLPSSYLASPKPKPQLTMERATSRPDSIKLYQMASQLEQEISQTLQTFQRCLKEVPETYQYKSLREKEIMNHVRHHFLSCITDYTLSLKNLRQRITQMELRIIEHVYVTLKRMISELKNVSFIGCLLPEMEDCALTVKNEVELKAKTLDEFTFDWEQYEPQMYTRVMEENQNRTSLLNLPPNAHLYRVVVPRVVGTLRSLHDYISNSIAGKYFPDSLAALRSLSEEFDRMLIR